MPRRIKIMPNFNSNTNNIQTKPEFKSICHVNLAAGFHGGERQTVILIRTLQKEYPEITQFLVCRKNGELPEYVKDIPNLTVIQVRNELFGHVVLNTRAEIIHAHEAKAVHFAAIHHALYKTPYIITRRVPQLIKNSTFNRYGYDHASFISSVSNAIRSSVIKSFGSDLNLSGKLTVIHDAFTPDRGNQEETDRIRKNLGQGPVFGHIGAYVDRHKGQKVFIEAIRKLVKDLPNAVFIFLGSGRDETELKELTKDLPQVKWLGFKNNVADYINAMDYFVFPSRNEGLGSILLDVMYNHVPVVASATDGITEVIMHEQNGLLFENGNSEDLYQKITELVKDDDLKNRMKKNADEIISKYAPELYARKHAALYTDIIMKVNQEK